MLLCFFLFTEHAFHIQHLSTNIENLVFMRVVAICDEVFT